MPSRKCPPNEVLKEMYLSPMSPRQIALKLNIKLGTVAGALDRIPGFKKRSNAEAQLLEVKNGKQPTRPWLGKKQPREMVEHRSAQFRGEKHWFWKGGIAKQDHVKVIKKEHCADCGARTNLCIHHIDFDHYNNSPENLKVMCVTCHMSFHKKEYWKAVKAGKEPKRSTQIYGTKKRWRRSL